MPFLPSGPVTAETVAAAVLIPAGAHPVTATTSPTLKDYPSHQEH